MVSAVVPNLPVVLTNSQGETTTASSPREYWQAIYEGFQVTGPVPPTPRDQLRASLADVDNARAWRPNTAYATGAPAISPSGDLVVAKAAFTSGSSYDATKWQLPPLQGSTFVSSPQVRSLEIKTTAPTDTGTAGVLEIPDVSWLENHYHLENMPAYSIVLRGNNYAHPWHSSPVTTLNLGAFSGALWKRLNMAPFYWPEASTAFQSFHAEITTVGTGVVRFGIYDHDFDAGAPGATFVDLGTIDSTVLGIQNIVTNYTLSRGWKWLAWCWQGTNTSGPTLRARTPEHGPAAIQAASGLDLSNRRGGIYPSITDPVGALPAGPFLVLNPNDSTVPSVALKKV